MIVLYIPLPLLSCRIPTLVEVRIRTKPTVYKSKETYGVWKWAFSAPRLSPSPYVRLAGSSKGFSNQDDAVECSSIIARRRVDGCSCLSGSWVHGGDILWFADQWRWDCGSGKEDSVMSTKVWLWYGREVLGVFHIRIMWWVWGDPRRTWFSSLLILFLHLHLIKFAIPPVQGSRDILYSQFLLFRKLHPFQQWPLPLNSLKFHKYRRSLYPFNCHTCTSRGSVILPIYQGRDL
jgi:hypothetical protein